MSKTNLKYLKKLKLETEGFNDIFKSYFEKIKKEHQKVIIQELNGLINKIAIGEELDENYLREKYLDNENIITLKKNKKKHTLMCEQDLLDITTIDETKYYYENKENGNIFDKDSNIVGVYSNSEFILNI